MSRQSGRSTNSKKGGDPYFSFLFVVNELYSDNNQRRISDRWGNWLPPIDDGMVYSTEEPSLVFRYMSRGPDHSEVEVAEEWAWSRTNGHRGYIHKFGSSQREKEYVTYTVFRGWRFLPLLVFPADTMARPEAPRTDQEVLYLVRLRETKDRPGVSRVDMASGNNYAAGHEPSWIPALIPEIYRKPSRQQGSQSEGLAGELAIILGLMGFTQPRDQAGDAFRYWRDHAWHLENLDSDPEYPGPDDDPRALLVQICYDPDNKQGSTERALWKFQWEDIIVRG